MITLYLLIFLTITTTLPYVVLIPYADRRANTNAAQPMIANDRNIFWNSLEPYRRPHKAQRRTSRNTNILNPTLRQIEMDIDHAENNTSFSPLLADVTRLTC